MFPEESDDKSKVVNFLNILVAIYRYYREEVLDMRDWFLDQWDGFLGREPEIEPPPPAFKLGKIPVEISTETLPDPTEWDSQDIQHPLDY